MQTNTVVKKVLSCTHILQYRQFHNQIGVSRITNKLYIFDFHLECLENSLSLKPLCIFRKNFSTRSNFDKLLAIWENGSRYVDDVLGGAWWALRAWGARLD